MWSQAAVLSARLLKGKFGLPQVFILGGVTLYQGQTWKDGADYVDKIEKHSAVIK